MSKIEIDAPPAVVFDTVMDPGRLADWVTIHRSVTLISGDALSEGARMDQVLHIRGVNFKVHWTLAVRQRPREAEWLGRGPAMSHALIRYRLSAASTGPPRLPTQMSSVRPAGESATSPATSSSVTHSEREAHDSLMKLKSLVESR